MNLMKAAEAGNINVVQLLLDKGANIQAATNAGYTPLYQAAEYCRLKVVKLLLDKGANINQADKDGNTALIRAAAKDHGKAVKILLDYGVDFSKVPKQGKYKGKKALEVSICSKVPWSCVKTHNDATKQFIIAGAFTLNDMKLIKDHKDKILNVSNNAEKITVLVNLIAAADQEDEKFIKENIQLLDAEKIHTVIDNQNFRIREKIDLCKKLLRAKIIDLALDDL